MRADLFINDHDDDEAAGSNDYTESAVASPYGMKTTSSGRGSRD